MQLNNRCTESHGGCFKILKYSLSVPLKMAEAQCVRVSAPFVLTAPAAGQLIARIGCSTEEPTQSAYQRASEIAVRVESNCCCGVSSTFCCTNGELTLEVLCINKSFITLLYR
jgi:hypothetical protein